jgi:hypothetical protein
MRGQESIKLLGVELTAPSFAGLLRMLGFMVAMVAGIEILDSMTHAAWANEASVGLIVGVFSGFLLSECGASFTRHGWRAFALLVLCGSLVMAAGSLVV